MTAHHVMAARVRGLFGRRGLDERLEQELNEHLEMLVERNLHLGMVPEEAERAARQELGNRQLIKESYREAAGIPWLEQTLQDACYAIRLLRKRPGLTALVTFILTLGIGATATVFSIRESVFFRPLPYPAPESMVLVGEAPVKNARPTSLGAARYSNFADWRAQNSVFKELAGWQMAAVNVTLGKDPARILHERVSEGYFQLLGVAPALGRTLTAADFDPAAPPVVVLSQRSWRMDFGASPDAIGRHIRVGGVPATIVGVMPATFASPVLAGGGRFWMPLIPERRERGREERTLQVVGRLRPGVSLARARAEMATIAARLAKEYPETNQDWDVRVQGMRELFSAAANTNASLVLGIGALLVLLITCANIANLLLARGVERGKEVALRAAMGAGRLRLLRQFFIESLLLSLGGGLAGLLVAYEATAALSRAALPLVESIGIERFTVNGRAVGFTVVVALATALLFGLVSALASSQLDPARAMNEGSLTSSTGRSKRRMTRLLVVSELTLAVMLLVSAVSLLRSLYHFWRLDWGFPIDHRLSLTVSLAEGSYPTAEHRLRFFHEALSRSSALSGVRSVALTSSLPVDQVSAPVFPVRDEAGVEASGGREALLARAALRVVSPDYLRALAIPLLRGRMFNEQDRAGAPSVAVINASLARRIWKDADPVGRRIEFNGQALTVVGVARDVAIRNLLVGPEYEVLVPHAQAALPNMTLVAHTSTEPAAVVAAVREVVRSLDPDQPVTNASTLESLRTELFRPIAVALNVLLLFGGSALLLATVGIYGVISHSVSARTREIGIRMALGARRSWVLSQVLGEGARLASIGVLLGSGAAVLLTKALSARVWWLERPGLQTLLTAGGLLVAVALAGCYFPAWRAVRVDPVAALRNE
jgi:putative ABC transport system permease protein